MIDEKRKKPSLDYSHHSCQLHEQC